MDGFLTYSYRAAALRDSRVRDLFEKLSKENANISFDKEAVSLGGYDDYKISVSGGTTEKYQAYRAIIEAFEETGLDKAGGNISKYYEAYVDSYNQYKEAYELNEKIIKDYDKYQKEAPDTAPSGGSGEPEPFPPKKIAAEKRAESYIEPLLELNGENAAKPYKTNNGANDPYKAAKAELDYRRNMDYIKDNQYFSELAALRDKYLAEDSDEWRAANVAIHNYEESLKNKNSSVSSAYSSAYSSENTGDKGQFVSITSYVPTMWDSDQTAALKSLIGKDVLGNTTSAHQINELTGAISMSAQSTADSGETNLADVVNAITKLQKRVDKLGQDVGDMTIELTARDLAIGKAAVRDINDMAKQSGKSPFKF